MVQLRRPFAFLSLALLFGLPAAIAHKRAASENDAARAIHLLNRMTFGPRPGDKERVLSMGLEQWVAKQLHPESIDDRTLEVRLAPLRTLRMSPRELVENFPPQAVIRQVAEAKQGLPRDPEKRAIYQAQLVRYREKQDKKVGALDQNDMTPPVADPGALDQSRLLALAPDARVAQLLKMTPEEQVKFLASLRGPERDQFVEGMTPEQRETVTAMNSPQQVVNDELMAAKILRATYSERQLEEVMTDFWLNHFNVFIGKGADRYEISSYERDVIRPHALGKFEDLLDRTAASPAMLFYLDNWLSVGPNSDFATGIRRNPRGRRHYPGELPAGLESRRRSGLNENYGRELMELHTLGVNGGYTQKDVTEVAKVFSGWTLKQPREGGGFSFEERMHEPGEKIVLGHRIKDGGQKEGYQVLHLLAHHPSTARFIAGKLAMRFVSDTPPPALVERMANTFLKKDGDIGEVLKTMLASPEFWSPEAYHAKVKTPLEFVVSALRATQAEVSDAVVIVRNLQTMGMPLYGAQPPTGYSMKAAVWVSSSALLGRMNFAIRLAAGRIRGVETAPLPPSPGDQGRKAMEALRSLENNLLSGDVSAQTHETISARLDDPAISHRRLDDPVGPPDIALIEGLLLGSPEFQRR
ncbi:MAG: DUF1800 domain-containing protein [Acidobacteria bacterium]|nr:DUF1800 domain-containing protein [Acidobacteriota bacterium]